MSAVHVWNPDEWEAFALSLLQSRHGALSVHKIPAAHKGDLGIDYYCTDPAVAYQCYAVQEPVDIAVRADRQKRKITTDVGKLIANANEVSKLFLGNRVRNWILLAPVHDSKEVNLHCSNKTIEVRQNGHAHLDTCFEIGIHDQGSFAPAVVSAGVAELARVVLKVPHPTTEEVGRWEAGSRDLLLNATIKLSKRTGEGEVEEAVAEAVRSFLHCNATLDALRSGSPDLHERVMSAVSGRRRRLALAGPQGGPAAGSILNSEIESLIAAIKSAAPNLSNDNAEQIALGTVSEWMMRCPLDFPPNVS